MSEHSTTVQVFISIDYCAIFMRTNLKNQSSNIFDAKAQTAYLNDQKAQFWKRDARLTAVISWLLICDGLNDTF